jgi:hypothetical protein
VTTSKNAIATRAWSGSPIHRVQRAEIILDWCSDKLR